MSSEPAIQVENLSKSYLLYATPADRLKQAIFPRRTYHTAVEALKPVTVSIGRGETVGIVGRNGSGKSTLLQLIVGTLTPSGGAVRVNGRIAALLELGAGFNPEFTGRENVFLNAALIGLGREETEAKLADILSFADIGDFIDRPVRTYSSGMFVRLAFAVAVSVEPEILVVDEALAVGDEAFQRRCFARLETLQKAGTTILFVSHAAQSVIQLCSRALLMDKGELLMDGHPRSVIVQYHRLLYGPAEHASAVREEIRALGRGEAPGALPSPAETPVADSKAVLSPDLKSKSIASYGTGAAEIEDVRIETPEGERVNLLVHGADYDIAYTVRFRDDAFGVRFGAFIRTGTGIDLGGTAQSRPLDFPEHIAAGSKAELRFRFRCRLMPGTWFVNTGVSAMINGERQSLHRLVDALLFQVQPDKGLFADGLVNFDFDPSLEIDGVPV